MEKPVIVRSGPDLFTQAALQGGGAKRVMQLRRHGAGEPDGYTADYYVALDGSALQGAISFVSFPEHPDTCFIDFLSVSNDSGPATRLELLEVTKQFPIVMADMVAAPTLVANEDFVLLSCGVFVKANRYVSDKEVNEICQMYRTRVSSLFHPMNPNAD